MIDAILMLSFSFFYLSLVVKLIHSPHATKTIDWVGLSPISLLFGEMVVEKSVGEEINWFSPFDCVGIKTQSCSPSAGLTLTASTMENTFSSQ